MVLYSPYVDFALFGPFANRTLKKESYKLREDYLNELADALEKAGKGKKSSIVKQLMATEAQRAIFRRLAIVNRKNQDLSTKFITVRTEEGSIKISDKVAMEKAIIKENKGK